jgi:hypothetical protein
MKQLSIYFYLGLIALSLGCEKDETMVMLKSDATPPSIISTPVELNPEITDQTLNTEFTIKWNKADYGVNTEVKYTLELDYQCGSFVSPVTLGSSTDNSFTLTLDNLNAKLVNDMKLSPHMPADLQLRIISTMNNNFAETSAPVAFTITPWSAWSPALWLVSDAWDVADAPAIYVTAENIYEGYAYLSSDGIFKFANSVVCEGTTYGGSGGSLSTDISSSGISVPTSGYYKINVDTENLTYQFSLIETWGMIGTATDGGWNSSTAMTYDATANVWKATVNLASGALKFRANNGWDINYGPANIDALSGILIGTNDAINIIDAGTYDVVIDFSQTKSPAYTYTVTSLSSGAVPDNLWVPGEYQGWSPSTAPTIKSVSENVFEGFVYFSSATNFKFTSAANWDNVNYGNSGTAGQLSTDGLAGDLSVAAPGYYRIKVNTALLTYELTLVTTMGMIGPATPGSWDTSTAMTFDAETGKWTKTINLVVGALKFRANDAWTINYGPADSNAMEGYLIFDDPGAISIPEAGNYTVTVDFSRAEAPYKYAYSVIKN